MEKETIKLAVNGTVVDLPNSWDTIADKDFPVIVDALAQLYAGIITPNEVLCRYVCSALSLSLPRIVSSNHAADLLAIAQRVTFLFTPSAPVLAASAASLHLQPNLNFARQFLPRIATHNAYTISTSCQRLTCSLTALQYIEAIDALHGGTDQLPLLASILYSPHPYDTAKALDLVGEFRCQPAVTLLSVRIVFEALVNFIYTRTPFSLLARFKPKKESPIATTMSDSLFDLATEGYGTVEQVEQMNVITFLSIMRKKTIDTVRSMRSMELTTPDIASRTGLPLSVINDIVQQ